MFIKIFTMQFKLNGFIDQVIKLSDPDYEIPNNKCAKTYTGQKITIQKTWLEIVYGKILEMFLIYPSIAIFLNITFLEFSSVSIMQWPLNLLNNKKVHITAYSNDISFV